MNQATQAIEELKEAVDTLIVVSNDKLLKIVPENTPVTDAFLVADDILRQGVVGISEIIIKPGLINVDFADVRSIMGNAGTALMGVGTGSGRSRAQDAAVAAISSPLLDFPIKRAKGIVFNVVGGTDLTLAEINAAAEVIYEVSERSERATTKQNKTKTTQFTSHLLRSAQNADPDANIIFGALVDPKMESDVSITVLATGFSDRNGNRISKGNGESLEDERKTPDFYSTRRKMTKSPLGANASVDETLDYVTRGKAGAGNGNIGEKRKRKSNGKSGGLKNLLRRAWRSL